METDSNYDTIPEDDALAYRSIHTAAILGLVISVVSSMLLLTAGSDLQATLLLAPIPIAGVLVSAYAMRAIASAKEVYTGTPMALAGLALSCVFLVLGLSYASYVYATEVPDGYERTSFLAMKPTEADLVNREVIPDPIKTLLGKQVFIKGYIRPDSIKYKENLDRFLLVRDNQQCCFGDPSKVKFFDQVRVQLAPGMTTDYHSGIFRVGGVLSIGQGNRELGTPITYTLDVDYLK